MSLVFRNTPLYGDVTIEDSWPQDIKDMWMAALGFPQPVKRFIPTFEPTHFVQLPDSPPEPLNVEYFATIDTATEMMRRYGARRVEPVPAVTGVNAFERWLVWDDGTAINAGMLAAYFLRDPEDLRPNVADEHVKAEIAAARARRQRVPGS